MEMDIVPTFMGAHAVPPEFKDDHKGYVDLVVDEMMPTIGKRRLARFCDVFCEKGIFDRTASERILTAARHHGMIPKIHCDEMEDIGGTEVAVQVGAVSAEHLAMTGADGIKRLAKAGIIGVLLPGTPFVLMKQRYPDARAMIQGGMPVALATDMNPNCWTESMQMVMTLACLQMKFSPEEALSAATINAAHAIGMGNEVGSIEVGKRADLAILSVPNYQHIPYRWGSNNVEMVIKAGKIVASGEGKR
jgi:imidazolonepropionase